MKRLSGIQFGTHGTTWNEGQTTIDPASSAGRDTNFEISDPNRTYYTPYGGNSAYREWDDGSVDASAEGWSWATRAGGKEEVNVSDPNKSVNNRGVVHHVEAEGEIADDEYSVGSTADRLRIKDTEWIRPPSGKEIGVQGTLPNNNWNRWGPLDDSPKSYDYKDYNNLGIGRDQFSGVSGARQPVSETPKQQKERLFE